MEFRILGPLEVADDGRVLALGGTRQRALLAILLLHADEVVSSDRLIEDLWGDNPPETRTKALHVAVSQLRKVLDQRNGAGSTGFVVTRPPGYMLRVDGAEFDLHRFQHLVDEAERARSEGESAIASAKLREGLALWRGRPLADIAYHEFAQRAIARLEESRLTALEDLIDSDLALGRHANLIAELEGLVEEHPLRERLRGQLMLALYRSGRQAEALRVYQETRRRLVDQLGIEPSVDLQRLEKDILAQEGTLELTRPPADRYEERDGPTPPPPTKRRLARSLTVARRRPGRLAAATVALVSVAGTAILATHLAGNDSAVATVPPNSVGVIDPRTNEIAEVIPVNERPESIVVATNAVWVVNRASSTVSRIDPRTARVVRTIGLGGFPKSLSVERDNIWVSDARSGVLSAIDQRSGLVRSYDLTRDHGNLQGIDNPVRDGNNALWMTAAWPPSVLLVSPVAGVSNAPEIQKVLPLPDIPSSVGGSNANLWVVSRSSGTVSPNLSTTIRVGSSPSAVAVGPDAVWVANLGDGTVSRIDPATYAVKKTIRVGQRPIAVALDPADHAVWVANSGDGTVSRIDSRTNKIVKTIAIGNKPVGLDVGDGRVWVTVDSE
jgi:YVTN family beta-propeller protein